MIEIKAPESLYEYKDWLSIFLAGSIDMGKAVMWQDEVVKALANHEVRIFNPRRDDWDSSWEQTLDNPKFVEQVAWEQYHIAYCDKVIYYFAKNSQAPITLMEFGQMSWSDPANMIVFCEEGFWRKGNVDYVCRDQGIKQVDSMAQLIEAIEMEILDYDN